MEIELLKQLISIPSYVDRNVNEVNLAVFIELYIKKNLPWLVVTRQYIDHKKFNLIASNTDNPDLVFVSHMDTVQPSIDANKMLTPKVNDGKIYGLGANDMKGGITAVLCALKELGQSKRTCLIFDCDEEYNFAGIQKILNEYSYNPHLVICPEPTNLEIVNGCRGLIELEFDIIGKTAHAARPEKGINAIEKSVELVRLLRERIVTNDINELGITSVNLSSINGGRMLANEIVVQTNAVPDISRIVLDIRSANPKLSGQKVNNLVKNIAQDLQVFVEKCHVNIDYSSYISEKNSLIFFEKATIRSGISIQYRDTLSAGGFYEAALISSAWNCPAISYGPGPGITAHTKDECVDINSLIQTKEVFKTLISTVSVAT